MTKVHNITKLFEIDIGAERDLEAVVSNSFIDGYLTTKIKELMALVDINGQHNIVDIVYDYVNRDKRTKYGNRYIDRELRWIFNRAEALRFNLIKVQPKFITKNNKVWIGWS